MSSSISSSTPENQGTGADINDRHGGHDVALSLAMEHLLKAHRPLKSIYANKAQADALVKSSGQTKNEACTIPGAAAPFADLDHAVAFLARAMSTYAEYSKAAEAKLSTDAAVYAGETSFFEARQTLQEAFTAAEAELSKEQSEAPLFKHLAPAKYQLSLAKRIYREIDKAPPAPTSADESEDQAAQINTVNAILAEYLLVTGNLIALHLEIESLVEEIGEVGNHVRSRIEAPIRPTEEEVQRYLSEVEGHITRRQKVHRLAKIAVARRPELLAQYEKLTAQVTAYGADGSPAEGRPDTLPLWYRRFVSHMIKEQQSKPQIYGMTQSYIYEKDYIQDGCASLDSAEVPAKTPAEDEAMVKLRKQMRVVAYALGHKSEAKHGLAAMHDPDHYISSSELRQCTDWQELSRWFKSYAQDRAGREQDKLVYAKKQELLKRAIAHHEEEEKREAASLHAMYSNIIPKLRRMPSDEMRVVLNACALLARPAGKEDNQYPIY